MRRGVLIGVSILVAAVIVGAALLLLGLRRPSPIVVGVIHSHTGPLASSERPLLDAYALAVAEINAAGGVLGRPLELRVRDGASRPEVFARELEQLLRDPDVAVVAGGWSSAARKAMLPVLERHRALLLYPVQFEGLERHPHVVYLGAVPNQQMGPAIEWAAQRGASRAFLVGSDYVYPHIAHAIARDVLAVRGIEVVGEAYVPLDGGDLRAVAQRIAESSPDLILNTINGQANVALMQALREIGAGPDRVMLISFSLTELAIAAMGPALFEGGILAGSYFRSVELPANERFLRALRRQAGPDAPAGDAMVAAYLGLHLWADSVADAGVIDAAAVQRTLRNRHAAGPGGPIVIDPSSLHAWKPARLGRVRRDGGVDILWESESTIPPVTHPMWRSEREWEQALQSLFRAWGGSWQGDGSISTRSPIGPAAAHGEGATRGGGAHGDGARGKEAAP